MKRIIRLAVLFGLLLAASGLRPTGFVRGQESQEGQTPKEQFDAVFSDWKENLKALRLLYAQAEQAEDDELPALSKQFDDLLAKGEVLVPKLRDAAIKVFEEAPNEDPQIAQWLSDLTADFVAADRFSEAAPTAKALIAGKVDDPVIYNHAGVVAFAQHDFANAKKYFEVAASAGVLTGQSQAMMLEVDNYIEYWKREKALTEKADALQGDARLPRVKIETNRGTLVVELFEDEAPETVGNFVSLVQNGFYDGLTFHRVLGAFMAQAGCPDGTGGGGPGYRIYCECVNKNHRKHFTGSLSMAHVGRDTGGSQFFITFVPAPHLNGKHTVFGRVIEGLDVLPKLQRRDPDKSTGLAIQPDKIIKAEVIHKRDHRYVPNKVK